MHFNFTNGAGQEPSSTLPSIPSAESTFHDQQRLRLLRDAVNVEEVIEEEFGGSVESAFRIACITSHSDALRTLLTHPDHALLQRPVLLQLQVEGVLGNRPYFAGIDGRTINMVDVFLRYVIEHVNLDRSIASLLEQQMEMRRGSSGAISLRMILGDQTFCFLAQRGCYDLVKLIFEHPRTRHVVDPGSGFILACGDGHANIAQYIMESASDRINMDSFGSAVHAAACGGHSTTVEYLMCYQDRIGKDLVSRALDGAASHGRQAVVSILIQDVRIESDDLAAAMCKGAWHNHTAVVQLILDDGRVDVNACIFGGGTAILDSAVSPVESRVEVINMILLHPHCVNLDINQGAGSRGSAFLQAIESRAHHENITCLLHDARTDVDAPDCEGKTPLHALASSNPDYCCYHGVRVIRRLLARKAWDASLEEKQFERQARALRRFLPDEMILKAISFLMDSPASALKKRDGEGRTPIDLAEAALANIPDNFTEYIRSAQEMIKIFQEFERDWMTFLPGRENTIDNFVLDATKMSRRELKEMPFRMRHEITAPHGESSAGTIVGSRN
eukprot:gene683-267_t